MHVTNTTGDDRYVPAVGDFVKAGEEVEVDADTGQGLVEQGWTSATQKAAKRRARTQRAKANETDDTSDTPTEAVDPADPQED